MNVFENYSVGSFCFMFMGMVFSIFFSLNAMMIFLYTCPPCGCILTLPLYNALIEYLPGSISLSNLLSGSMSSTLFTNTGDALVGSLLMGSSLSCGSSFSRVSNLFWIDILLFNQ